MTGTSVVQRIYRLERSGQAVYAHSARVSPTVLMKTGDSWKATYLVTTDRARSSTRRDARILAPCRPSKIVAVGLNYRDHAVEMKKPLPDEPMIFIKPSTAVIGPNDAIEIPTGRRSGGP